MKRSLPTIAIIAVLFTALTTLSGCRKEIYFTDMQEWNTGALIWNWKLLSITVEQDHKTFEAKDYPDLQDDGITFYADRTGRRYQGTKLFPFAPQVSEFKFEWGIDSTQTDIFYLKAPGTTGPKNYVTLSVSADHQVLTMIVFGEKSFYTYKYRQQPD